MFLKVHNLDCDLIYLVEPESMNDLIEFIKFKFGVSFEYDIFYLDS